MDPVQQVTERREAVRVLLDLTRRLNDTPDLDEALAEVADAALELLPGDHASVRVIDETGHGLLSAARAGLAAMTPAPAHGREGVAGWVVGQARSTRVGDAATDPRFVEFPDQGFTVSSMVLAPLRVADRVVGVLSVSHTDPYRFTDDDEALATLLANCTVSRIEQARLQRLALTDDLTHALNQRSLAPRMLQELDRARRYDEQLSVVMMDLDHFKRVNDTYGHLAGDLVLSNFADRVRAVVRRADLLVRWGGEEFLLLLPETDADAARSTAERVRVHIAERPFVLEDGTCVHQTVSLGVATWDRSEDQEALLARADAAVYAAKSAGRDTVCVAT